jgi:hypothetical protein
LRASVSKSHAGAGAGALADALKGHIANELDTPEGFVFGDRC